MLKREAELLLKSIADATLEIQQTLVIAPSLSDEAAASAGQFAIDQNRAIRFNAQRLIALIEHDSEALREVYALSVHIVDNLRIACSLNNSEFLADAETSLAAMQATIEALFPNETLAG